MDLNEEFNNIKVKLDTIIESMSKERNELRRSTDYQPTRGHEKQYFSISEAAEYLGISVSSFKQIANSQKLTTYRFANVKKNLFKKHDIERLVNVKYPSLN